MSEIGDLADELVRLRFDADPLLPSFFGLPGDADRLADLSLENERRLRDAYLSVAARAEIADVGNSSDAEIVTRDVVVQQARAAVDLLDARSPEYAVSAGFVAPAFWLLLGLPAGALSDEERARGYLARLAAVPSFLDTLTERHRIGLAEGLVPPDFLVDAGAEHARRYAASADSDPLRVDAKVPVAGFERERDRLLADVVRPAYARYGEFLAEEVRPKAMPSSKPGLSWLPGGERMYAGLVRAHTTTNRSPEDLHETGLAMIEALAEEYGELGGRVFGTREPPEIFRRLRTDPGLRWRNGDELLDGARAAIRRAEVAAPKWFGTVPSQRCEVEPVPAAEAESGAIGYYFEAALDGTRPGVYYANTFKAEERSRHVSEAIAFHEAVPGHHFQLCLAQGLTDLPLLRRIAEVNSYIEGWGLYAERLADEMGLYSDDVSRLGMLTQDSMRAGRLVVDTGMHALGWSRQRAVDFLTEHTPMATVEIETEIDRYAGCPGQALSYMVGRLEIQRIRADAEAALGDRFDIRDFHDVVLGGGALPLPVLDHVVRSWVTAR